MNRLILKKIILHITFLLLFCCETSPGYNDIEIVNINGLTYGLLKSNNSLFTEQNYVLQKVGETFF